MKATLCARVTVVVLFLVVSLCKTSYGYEIRVLVTEYTEVVHFILFLFHDKHIRTHNVYTHIGTCYIHRHTHPHTLTPSHPHTCLIRFENGRPALPTLSELKQYRVVVVTLSTSRILSLMGLPRGHFSFIFIDEAAQVSPRPIPIPRDWFQVVCGMDRHWNRRR